MQERLFENEADDGEADPDGPNAIEWHRSLSKTSASSDPPLSLSALGSAPYVERTLPLARANIRHLMRTALTQNLHLDFHLDYDVREGEDAEREALIWYVIEQMREMRWLERANGKVVTIGHATRLSMFSSSTLKKLRESIGDLPIHFVGLPQSDVYMMGRPNTIQGGEERQDGKRVRGTMRVPGMIEHGFKMSISINNVGNAFTPQGDVDPLGLCTLGVAVYQSGTEKDCRRLLVGYFYLLFFLLMHYKLWAVLLGSLFAHDMTCHMIIENWY